MAFIVKKWRTMYYSKYFLSLFTQIYVMKFHHNLRSSRKILIFQLPQIFIEAQIYCDQDVVLWFERNAQKEKNCEYRAMKVYSLTVSPALQIHTPNRIDLMNTNCYLPAPYIHIEEMQSFWSYNWKTKVSSLMQHNTHAYQFRVAIIPRK